MNITLSAQALKDLKGMDRKRQQQILDKIEAFQRDPASVEIQKLRGQENQFRLRVGTYRIRLEIDWVGGQCEVKRIRHRKEAYRDV